MMGFGGAFGGIFMIFFLVIVIAVIVFMVKAGADGEGKKKDTGSAVDILKKRYAKGEISSTEFETMKKHIEK